MISFFQGFLAFFSAFFRSRYNLSLEIIALRQQLGVLKRKTPRPRLRMVDRVFWILLHRLWPGWCNALIVVKPETVVGWHRAGFRLYWCIRSRSKNIGRPKIDAEIRAIIRRMVKENPTWGAPRIHGELLKLGFQVSERTVSRYLRRLSPSDQKGKLWAAFLRNHREVIAAMDFFSGEALTMHGLVRYSVLFVIDLKTRCVQLAGVAHDPHGAWMEQVARNLTDVVDGYLRNTRYLIHDRDPLLTQRFTEILGVDGGRERICRAVRAVGQDRVPAPSDPPGRAAPADDSDGLHRAPPPRAIPPGHGQRAAHPAARQLQHR